MKHRVAFATSGGLAPADVVTLCVAAERAGYESFWVAEGHGGDHFALLAACAVATSRIGLGTAVTSVFVRSAPTIAMAAATVDALSGGRFTLGIGSSHRVQVEPEHGIEYARPLTRTRETLDVVRRIVRDGTIADYHGETVSIRSFDLWFEPHRSELPIYVAALFPKMLEFCGASADGVIATRTTLDRVPALLEPLRRGARAAGRDPDDVDVATLLPCLAASSAEVARDTLRPGVAFYVGYFPRYANLMAESGFERATRAIRDAWMRGDEQSAVSAVPDAMLDLTCVVGTPAEVRERIQRYRDAGILLPILGYRGADLAAALETVEAARPAPQEAPGT